MARPPEKLAQSLEILQKLQTAEGAGAIRARDLSRTHRERLLRNGFLQEVIKGWYIPSRPDEVKGESTAWYASFWRFSGAYLEARFGARWCLSPEQSLSLHAGNWTVPCQLAARSPRAGNKVTKLLHGTSLLELRIALPAVADRKEEADLRLYSVESALIACSPNYFSNNATDVRAVLPMIRDASGLLARLLEGGHTVIAGRLAGAFRNMGRDRIADDIVKTMTAAGYAVRENDPFTDKPSLVIRARETSPYVNRLRLLWQKMREPVIGRIPKARQRRLRHGRLSFAVDRGLPGDARSHRSRPRRRLESGSRRGRSRTAERPGGAGLLAGLSSCAEKPPQNSEGRKSGRSRGRGPRYVVSRAVRAERHRRHA
jgi:hypothetical protein